MSEAIKELITKMADDALIMGHRNSEWTGIGPILEEDIAMSSMAQDKVGHALALYNILHDHFGEADPDTIGFRREDKDFKCCHLVELPIGEYDFTMARHFLFDQAEILRYQLLRESSFEPLAHLAKKIHGELKYHVMHANSWLSRLGKGSDESRARIQSSLNYCYPLALGVFEQSPYEEELISKKIFEGEKRLHAIWEENIFSVAEQAHLTIPKITDETSGYGGRKGNHTEHLKPLLEEMAQVVRMEGNVEW